jgi:dihydrodiol dehydrogenase / D-xylose 1-dehydrogenase (NADP)
LINLAKEKNLFLMEGMWTRFFPAVTQARRLVCGSGEGGDKGILGQVVSVHSDFNFKASDHEVYPTSFVYNHKLGGGSSLLVAPYPVAAATLFFKGEMPDRIQAAGQVDKETGVDLQAAVALSFPPTGTVAPAVDDSIKDEMTPKLPGAGVATLLFGMLGESEEETIILGTKGRLTIENPSHCPTKLRLVPKDDGHRAVAAEMSLFEYTLPADTKEIIDAGGYFYPNSAGFAYEAAAVARCIAAGKTEAPQFNLSETLVSIKIIDELRSQLGVKPVPPP